MVKREILKIGQRIIAGEGDNRDTGIVGAIEGNQVTVQWDSGVVTTQTQDVVLDAIDKRDRKCLDCNGSGKVRA